MYTAQTVFKVLKFILIVSYATPLLSSISFSHVCQLHSHALTGYSLFQCSHSLSSVLRKLMQAYILLLFLFGLLGVYALFWIFHKYGRPETREDCVHVVCSLSSCVFEAVLFPEST